MSHEFNIYDHTFLSSEVKNIQSLIVMTHKETKKEYLLLLGNNGKKGYAQMAWEKNGLPEMSTITDKLVYFTGDSRLTKINMFSFMTNFSQNLFGESVPDFASFQNQFDTKYIIG